jgi:hypothetical protein
VGMHSQPLSAYYQDTFTYKVAVYAPAEMADTLPVFHLYPICTHGFRPSWDGAFRFITSQASSPMQPGRRCGPGYPHCLAGQTYCPSTTSAPSTPLGAQCLPTPRHDLILPPVLSASSGSSCGPSGHPCCAFSSRRRVSAAISHLSLALLLSGRPHFRTHPALLIVFDIQYYTLQRTNTENSKHIFPEKELRGHSPNFRNHVSVSDLYIPTIDMPILLQENM